MAELQPKNDPTLQDLAFDYTVIAQNIRASRRRKKLSVPELVRLSTAITSVRYDDTIEGSSTLVVELIDPTFELIEFFDVDRNGRIDIIDLNYPNDSANWWRLTQLGASTTGGTTSLTLTFMERPAVLLMLKHGPKKAKRGRTTRAEFLKALVEEVKPHPISFVCQELHKPQKTRGAEPVSRVIPAGGGGSPTPPAPVHADPPGHNPKRRHDKTKGINKDYEGTIAGGKPNNAQLREVDTTLRVVEQEGADNDIARAILCAGIGESNFKPVPNKEGSNYHGVFQGSKDVWDINDTAGMARCFINGGKGYQPPPSGNDPGGARYWHHLHKDWGPGLIAVSVEGSRANFGSDALAENHYGQWASEADALIEWYGGGFHGGGSYHRAAYNFQVGSEENPNESYWDAMRRLAVDDVRWRIFVDGKTVYYDDDMTLIRQQPIAVIRRGDPAVVSWSIDWDRRKIATEMTLDLICDPFAFRAGEVFHLRDFGPLSRGSTAKPDPLPGRWLIAASSRDSGSYVTSFTLVQPQRPLREPAAEVVEDEDIGEKGGSLTDLERSMTASDVIEQLVLPIGRKHGLHTAQGKPLNRDNVFAANATHGPTSSGGRSNHQGPPDTNWAVDMGMGTSQPTPQMDGCADELARRFGFTVHQHTHSYPFNENPKSKGFTFELGYRTDGHYDHVHFGVVNSNPPSQESLDSKYGHAGTGSGV